MTGNWLRCICENLQNRHPPYDEGQQRWKRGRPRRLTNGRRADSEPEGQGTRPDKFSKSQQAKESAKEYGKPTGIMG